MAKNIGIVFILFTWYIHQTAPQQTEGASFSVNVTGTGNTSRLDTSDIIGIVGGIGIALIIGVVAICVALYVGLPGRRLANIQLQQLEEEQEGYSTVVREPIARDEGDGPVNLPDNTTVDVLPNTEQDADSSSPLTLSQIDNTTATNIETSEDVLPNTEQDADSSSSLTLSQIVLKVATKCHYEAKKDGELSFEKGYIIEVVQKINDEWWKGKCQESTGLFLVELVQEVTEDQIANFEQIGMISQITDSDMGDIIEVLTPEQLELLYPELGFTQAEWRRHAQSAHLSHPGLRARGVLRNWVSWKASNATRAKVVEAFERCRFRNEKKQLKYLWLAQFVLR